MTTEATTRRPVMRPIEIPLRPAAELQFMADNEPETFELTPRPRVSKRNIKFIC